MTTTNWLKQLTRRWEGPSIQEDAGRGGEPHQATLDRILNGGRAGRSPRELFGSTSDDFWLWCFTEGYRQDERLRAILPGFAPEEKQYQFAGAAGDDTMRDAFSFYSLVKNLLAQHAPGRPEWVLEFGCGWGRIIRFFLKDVEPDHLWGVDCMPQAIELCTSTNPYSRFELVNPFPPSNIPADTFDLIYSYSVFSHLSEAAHLAWLAEFQRILKPGGIVFATTRSREFILSCAEARAAKEERDWAQGSVLAFPNTAEALARFDRGEYLYEPLGGGGVLDASFFGETCIPLQYVVQHWTPLFEFIGYVDDRRYCAQNVIAVRKRA